MGEWFHVVCHTCQMRHNFIPSKRREILLNVAIAAQIGQFAALHAGHELELRGDEFTKLDDRDTYIYGDDDPAENEDVQYAMKQLAHPAGSGTDSGKDDGDPVGVSGRDGG